MIYSYFRFKDKHYKTLEFIKDNLNSKDNSLSIAKKIKKLNEFQFFYLLNDVIYNHPIQYLSLDIIKLFFESRKTTIYDEDYLPFQDACKDRIIPNLHSFLSFNCKNELQYLVNYYLGTKEYPKEILITKLLVLSDKVLEDICSLVIGLSYSFQSYLEIEESTDKKTGYSMEIVQKLKEYEIDLQKLYETIKERIFTLSNSNPKKGNYTIIIDNKTLEKLYFLLEKFLFIDQTKTSLVQFIEVLKLDWDSHSSIIYFQMDNLQFKFFIDCFNQFLRTKIPLTFIENSGNIENKNGKIKANSIYASVSKSTVQPKDSDLIRSFFQQL